MAPHTLGVPVCPWLSSQSPPAQPLCPQGAYLSLAQPWSCVCPGVPTPPRLPICPGVTVNPICPGVPACHRGPARPSPHLPQGAASPEGPHCSLGSPLTPGWWFTPRDPTHRGVPAPPTSPRCSIAPGSLLPPGPPRGPRATPVSLGTPVPGGCRGGGGTGVPRVGGDVSPCTRVRRAGGLTLILWRARSGSSSCTQTPTPPLL